MDQKFFNEKSVTLSIFSSSSRADYGILKNLIIKLKKDKKFNLKLIVSGTHLEKVYGKTIKQIIKDKINVDHKIHIKLGSTSEKV